jgi:hypothetical protein
LDEKNKCNGGHRRPCPLGAQLDALVRAGALSPSQSRRLEAEWHLLDEDSHAQPWYRDITEMTWLQLGCPKKRRNY